MIRVTWSWLGQGLALDLADTVTIEEGAERDLIASPEEFRRWAEAEAPFVAPVTAGALESARSELLELRSTVRRALAAVSRGERPPKATIAELNRISRRAPTWTELDVDSLAVKHAGPAGTRAQLLAAYARSAIELIAEHRDELRRCGAPSCGMFYIATRRAQRWCSPQCGSRARVARHYRQHKSPPGTSGSS